MKNFLRAAVLCMVVPSIASAADCEPVCGASLWTLNPDFSFVVPSVLVDPSQVLAVSSGIGTNCGDLAVCASDDEIGYREVIIDSGSDDRDTRVDFSLDSSSFNQLDTVGSLSFFTVGFENAVTNEYLEVSLGISKATATSQQFLNLTIHNPQAQTARAVSEHKLTESADIVISIDAAPQSIDDFLVQVKQGRYTKRLGFYTKGVKSNIPELTGFRPTVMRYGNLGTLNPMPVIWGVVPVIDLREFRVHVEDAY